MNQVKTELLKNEQFIHSNANTPAIREQTLKLRQAQPGALKRAHPIPQADNRIDNQIVPALQTREQLELAVAQINSKKISHDDELLAHLGTDTKSTKLNPETNADDLSIAKQIHKDHLFAQHLQAIYSSTNESLKQEADRLELNHETNKVVYKTFS